MERRDRIDAFGATALTAFAFLLASNQVVVKLSTDGFSPVFMAGVRSAGAALVVLLWIRLRGLPRDRPSGSAPWGVLLGVFFGVEFIFLFLALDLTTVSRASVLFYTMPVWLTLAAHVLVPGERLTVTKACGLVLAVGGIVLTFSGRADEGQSSLAGDVLALLGAFGWAGIALVVKTTSIGQARAETQLFWQLAVSTPILLGASLFFGPALRDPTVWHGVGLLFQIFAIASFGFLAWFWLLKMYPASGVASFSFLSPVFSVLLGWLLLGEAVSAAVWGALALVTLGLVLINR